MANGGPRLFGQLSRSGRADETIEDLADTFGADVATVRPTDPTCGADAAAGNPNHFQFPPGTNVRVVGTEWQRSNPRKLQLQGMYGRVYRPVIVSGRLYYEVIFPHYGTGHLLPATDLQHVGSATYDNNRYSSSSPTQHDDRDEATLFDRFNTTWVNQTDKEELRDPAGFTDIISQSTVQLVNFGWQNGYYNLNGQLATVLYYNPHTREYCVAPYAAPHLRLHVPPHNISMKLYCTAPALFAPPSGADGFILPRESPTSLPTEPQFQYARSQGLSITPYCNAEGCTQPTAINDLCQYHAMVDNVQGVRLVRDRYLFRLRRPSPDPPDNSNQQQHKKHCEVHRGFEPRLEESEPSVITNYTNGPFLCGTVSCKNIIVTDRNTT